MDISHCIVSHFTYFRVCETLVVKKEKGGKL